MLVDCGDPPDAVSPLLVTSNDTVALYSCMEEYAIIGETESNCEEDGTWSEINTQCIGKREREESNLFYFFFLQLIVVNCILLIQRN